MPIGKAMGTGVYNRVLIVPQIIIRLAKAKNNLCSVEKAAFISDLDKDMVRALGQLSFNLLELISDKHPQTHEKGSHSSNHDNKY